MNSEATAESAEQTTMSMMGVIDQRPARSLAGEAEARPALPAFIRFGRAVCGDLDEAERREWWLANGLGAYAAGTVANTGNAAAALDRLMPMRDHLADAALGTISEILDGAAPHRPAGAPVQAWSVACTLEAWWRLQHDLAATAQG